MKNERFEVLKLKMDHFLNFKDFFEGFEVLKLKKDNFFIFKDFFGEE